MRLYGLFIVSTRFIGITLAFILLSSIYSQADIFAKSSLSFFNPAQILNVYASSPNDNIEQARKNYYSSSMDTSHISKPDRDSKTMTKAGEILVKINGAFKKSDLVKASKKIGAKIKEEYRHNGIYLIKLPSSITVEQASEYYWKSGIVEYAERNYIIESETTLPNDDGLGVLWNLDNIGQTGSGIPNSDVNAPEAWSIINNCSSIVVGVMDTGTSLSHDDIKDNLWINPDEIPDDGIDNDFDGYIDDVYGYDFAGNDADINPHTATDPGASHGTHVAGIIGAKGNNSIGITGICWDIRILTLKVFNEYGLASVNDIIEATQYAAMLKDRGVNLKIINMSFGHYGFSQTEYEALKNLRAEGILVTAAAGNNGYNSDLYPFYPAAYEIDNVVSVAASDDRDAISLFSNYGKNSVDIVAPGSKITSTIAGNGYSSWSGTSMAAPHVAGAAALISSSDDTLQYDQIRAKILNGADQKSQFQGKVTSSGRLNLFGALSAEAGLPDIQAISIKAPSFAEKASSISLQVSVKNVGDVQSDSSTVELFASTSQDFDSNVVMVGAASMNSLSKGGSQIISMSYKMPSVLPSQNYYFLTIVDYDNNISESDENNNTIELTLPTTNQDLTISKAPVPSKISLKSKVPKISVEVKNTGKSTIKDSIEVKMYLSSDRNLDANDLELANKKISTTLKSSKTTKLVISLKIPKSTPLASYYIITKVDPSNSVYEVNDENNINIKAIKLIK